MPSPTLQDLETLVRQAGEILNSGYNNRPGFGEELHVERKGAVDLVSEIDLRTEQFLLKEIHQRFPGHSVVAEESGSMDDMDCCIWYVDPVDGTINYVHGLPFFCVSLAFSENGEMKLGAVYEPVRDECFSAERGKGAYLNGLPIRASAAENLNESLLVTGFSYDIRDNPENNMNYFTRFSLLTRSVRRLGSAALDLCYVAAGRVDGYWELKIHPWDFAAGALIAGEAGALVTNLVGEAELLKPPYSILACSPGIQREMLEVLLDSS